MERAPLKTRCDHPSPTSSRRPCPLFHDGGRKTANARVSVWQNGLKIHDDVEIDGPTEGGAPEMPESRPIRLKDGKSPVSFRNIWVVPR
jgi:hypothetical protein